MLFHWKVPFHGGWNVRSDRSLGAAIFGLFRWFPNRNYKVSWLLVLQVFIG